MKNLLLYYNDLVFTPSELFLNKDFGQVPYVLGELYSYETEYLISCNKPNREFNYFYKKKVNQIKKIAQYLPNRLDFLKNIFVYLFLIINTNKYDALVLIPFYPFSDFFFFWLFKVLNPRARIIVKLDTNYNQVCQCQENYMMNKNNLVRRFLSQPNFYKQILKKADLIIYETIAAGGILENNFLGLSLKEKLLNVYNSVSEKQMSLLKIDRKVYADKRNQIVISGRIGSPEKNIEMVFRANPILKNDWRIVFVGPIEKGFDSIINDYRKKIMDFDDKFVFCGLISDKKEYFEILNNSKVLLLTSNKEGFPMVFSEALYFGLFIITTDVSGGIEATNNGRLGKLIQKGNADELKTCIESICSQDYNFEALVPEIINYSKTHFIWEKNLSHTVIKKLME